ncbi:plastocyanin/azurin family copper-binding protein [Natrialbaceae archaeon AArc-T1-2]|uniref:plastocyanin/azurin family copper-binding protein n=1 Tax=Natrialbaceae archaeon AArc-T1-2 TaxID=3053904 RepID=UPI00255B2018|nr:plastocyanin/azurin family copper-binding protein [Natrialbaceae archaeon AArc-T1-2]WIV67837.1 plastocyanin/azurin family copper-binding protein [Natrialbaceae archaeon AArc-T1-2]
MDRRRVLFGSGTAMTTILAGCLDDGGDEEPATAGGDDESLTDDGTDDEEPDADDGDEPTADEADGSDVALESACDAGETVVEAVAASEYEEAIEHSGYQYVVDRPDDARSTLRDQYESVTKPDTIHAIDCAETESNDRLREDARETFDADVGDAVVVTYTVDLEAGGERTDSSLEVIAFELDGDWYAVLQDDLVPTPRAAVTVDGDGSDAVAVTLTSLSGADGVYVRGGSIDDPTPYVLEEVGETLTITADDEGDGEYVVVAYVGDGPSQGGNEVVVQTFRVVDTSADEAAWEDVHEIELDGPIAGWIGVSPDHIDGVENPTLRLVAGREYDLTWTNVDGGHHNVALVDETGDVVADYETEIMSEEGASQTLTFTATTEIAQYICEPHPQTKRGDVEFIDH